MVFVSLVFCFMLLFVRSGGSWLEMSGWGSLRNSAVLGLGFTESALWSKLAKKRPVARRPAPGWKGDALPRPSMFVCQLFFVCWLVGLLVCLLVCLFVCLFVWVFVCLLASFFVCLVVFLLGGVC